jgi:heme/copper-type cytochrome/quinol oxidase subunit 4
MTNLTNMPWTFVVVFATIFAVITISAVIWLMSQGPSHRHK